MAFLGLAAGIREHAFCDGIVLQDADVKAEMLDKPVPGLSEIDRTHAYLLDSGDIE